MFPIINIWTINICRQSFVSLGDLLTIKVILSIFLSEPTQQLCQSDLEDFFTKISNGNLL